MLGEAQCAELRRAPNMNQTKKSVTMFLNVDLDLRAHQNLDELLRFLEPFVLVMNKTAQDATVELNQGPYSLDETLMKFVEIIQSLPQRAKDLWNECEFRRFNIGIQGENEPHEEHFSVSEKTIALLTSIRSELLLTVYAPTQR
jgi:hypothetical protein